MSRVSMFSSPLLLGFDQLERTLERLAKNAEGYPPYNIERIGDNGLRITLAVAGFTSDDLAIELVENQLSVRGKQTDDTDPRLPSPRHRRPSVPARFHAGRRHRGDRGAARQRAAVDRPRAAAGRTAHPNHPHRLRPAGRCGQDDRHHRAPYWLALNAAKEVAMENNQTTTPVFTPLADDAFLSLGHAADRLHQVGRPARRRACGGDLLRRRQADGGRGRGRDRAGPACASTSSSRPSSTESR